MPKREITFCPPRTKNKPHRVTQASSRMSGQSHTYSTSTKILAAPTTPPALDASHVRPPIEVSAPPPRHRGRSRPEHRDSYLHPEARSNPSLIPGAKGAEERHRCSRGSGPRRQTKDGYCRGQPRFYGGALPQPLRGGHCPGTFSRSVVISGWKSRHWGFKSNVSV